MAAVGRLLSIADIFSVCFEEVKIASMGKQGLCKGVYPFENLRMTHWRSR